MSTKFMIAILLFCNLVFLNLALADRGGVSGGGGEDGLRPELIDLNGDRSKLFLKCPGEQIPLECSECKSAITKEGNVIQSKLDTICEMNFKNQ